MIPFEQSLKILDHELTQRDRLRIVEIPVTESFGHTLAQPALSMTDLPPFNKSAMDGYALLAGDFRDQYDVAEHVQAGKSPVVQLRPGQAARIMTGAPVPDGTDRVVMWEDTDNGMVRVQVTRHSDKSNICLQGEDVRSGDKIFSAGQVVTPIVLANLLTCGVTHVQVYSMARVAIVVTGDEVTDSPDHLKPGMILDANGPLLEALCRTHQLDLVERTHVPDDLQLLTQTITQLAEQVDLLVLTGGVSAGDYDFVGPALLDAGFTTHYDEVAVQPGKPLTLATSQKCVAIGLPGNPVSVLNGFYVCVLRAVALLSGRCPDVRSFRLPLGCDFQRKRAARSAFVPVRIDESGRLYTLDYHGSAHLLAMASSDGMMFIPEGVQSIAEGEPVVFFPRF